MICVHKKTKKEEHYAVYVLFLQLRGCRWTCGKEILFRKLFLTCEKIPQFVWVLLQTQSFFDNYAIRKIRKTMLKLRTNRGTPCLCCVNSVNICNLQSYTVWTSNVVPAEIVRRLPGDPPDFFAKSLANPDKIFKKMQKKKFF